MRACDDDVSSRDAKQKGECSLQPVVSIYNQSPASSAFSGFKPLHLLLATFVCLICVVGVGAAQRQRLITRAFSRVGGADIENVNKVRGSDDPQTKVAGASHPGPQVNFERMSIQTYPL